MLFRSEAPKVRGQGKRERREAMYRRGLDAFSGWLTTLGAGAGPEAEAQPAAVAS